MQGSLLLKHHLLQFLLLLLLLLFFYNVTSTVPTLITTHRNPTFLHFLHHGILAVETVGIRLLLLRLVCRFLELGGLVQR